MNQYELEVWQRPARNQYFQPAPTTYYETTRRENRGQGGLVARLLGAAAANGILGWAAWSAHQACLHGNAHSVLAEGVVAAASAGSAGLAAKGFTSKTDRGSWLGAVFSPISLLLAVMTGLELRNRPESRRARLRSMTTCTAVPSLA